MNYNFFSFKVFMKKIIITKKYIIHDISVKLYNGMPVWPGNRHKFLHSFAKLMDDNDEINLSRLDMSMHTGTHIDAPFHKINTGKKLHPGRSRNDQIATDLRES